MKILSCFLFFLLFITCQVNNNKEIILDGFIEVRECDFNYDWRQNLDSLKAQLRGAELTERDSTAFTWNHINIETEKTPAQSKWNIVYVNDQDYAKYFSDIDLKALKNSNTIYHVKLLVKKYEDPEYKVLKVLFLEKQTGKTTVIDC